MNTTFSRAGASLVEILIAIIIVSIASVGTLTYFANGFGGVNKQGNRRAALERARQRLEQLMAVDVGNIHKSAMVLNTEYYVTCDENTGACVNNLSTTDPGETVSVEDLSPQKIQSSVICRYDGGPVAGACDILEISAKVWFTPGSTAPDDFHRVHLRTLRVP